MRPLATAAITNGSVFRNHSHGGPIIRQPVANARTNDGSQSRGVEREEPNAAAASRADDIGPHICFGKMRNSPQIVNLERDQADPCGAIERVQLQSWRK